MLLAKNKKENITSPFCKGKNGFLPQQCVLYFLLFVTSLCVLWLVLRSQFSYLLYEYYQVFCTEEEYKQEKINFLGNVYLYVFW